MAPHLSEGMNRVLTRGKSERLSNITDPVGMIYLDGAIATGRTSFMRAVLFLLVLLVGHCTLAQTLRGTADDPYPYRTRLKGGYTISYKVDDDMQYLYLKKGRRRICELSGGSRGMLYKNLGYVAGDFPHYFVFAQSFGSGNPHYINLIQKSTGKNLLKGGCAGIDINEKNGYFLYSELDVPEKGDQMVLYLVESGRKERFPFPEKLSFGGDMLSRIRVKRLTARQLVIEYEADSGTRTKTYARRRSR